MPPKSSLVPRTKAGSPAVRSAADYEAEVEFWAGLYEQTGKLLARLDAILDLAVTAGCSLTEFERWYRSDLSAQDVKIRLVEQGRSVGEDVSATTLQIEPDVSADSRKLRRAYEDVHRLTARARRRGLEPLLRQILEGRIAFADVLPPDYLAELKIRPAITIGKEVPRTYWPSYRAQNARKIITAVMKSRRMSDYDREGAVDWIIKAISDGSDQKAAA